MLDASYAERLNIAVLALPIPAASGAPISPIFTIPAFPERRSALSLVCYWLESHRLKHLMDSSPYHLRQNSQRSLSIVRGAIEDHSSIPHSYISNQRLTPQAKQADAQKGTPRRQATGQTHIALMTGMWILIAVSLVVNPWGKKARH